MKSITLALAVAVLLPGLAYAAGPANPADRYDYNMRATNKDGYVPDPARVSNKDGYVPDAARSGDKFDPYTQGANQSTSSALKSCSFALMTAVAHAPLIMPPMWTSPACVASDKPPFTILHPRNKCICFRSSEKYSVRAKFSGSRVENGR